MRIEARTHITSTSGRLPHPSNKGPTTHHQTSQQRTCTASMPFFLIRSGLRLCPFQWMGACGCNGGGTLPLPLPLPPLLLPSPPLAALLNGADSRDDRGHRQRPPALEGARGTSRRRSMAESARCGCGLYDVGSTNQGSVNRYTCVCER